MLNESLDIAPESDRLSEISSKEPRYWKRVWIVAKGLATGWRRAPEVLWELAISVKHVLKDLCRLAGVLILPVTFILAPIWVVLIDKSNAKRARDRKEAREAVVAGLYRNQKPSEDN